MASSVIKLDVVVTTIQKISSKTFKTFFHMVEKTCYRLCWKFLRNWNRDLIYATFWNRDLIYATLWQFHIGMSVCQFPRNVLLELKLFKIDKAFAN